MQISLRTAAVASPVANLRTRAASRLVSAPRRCALRVVAKEFTGDYIAQNKYKCLNLAAKNNLLSEWDSRKSNMSSMPGFLGFSLQEVEEGVYEATQTWASKEAYEAWMDSDEKRKSHFFGDIFQFPSKDKYNVQEEFMPIMRQ
eukprot:CAMPEP_0114253254 /NCGR_PEP_ID=MMETSP0058-20121206/16287_1 /TAXON_ID=36894 /ORGANISM="Pyramimonas parkeae, CCMP726" /LENGTH=143 /DNA_ID=CAMNT_0001367273 /DNA_START=59 /DNA_END=490 /DNA_ORIENTATION=+